MAELKISSVDKLGLIELKRIDTDFKKPILSTTSASTYHDGRRIIRTFTSDTQIASTVLNSSTFFTFTFSNNVLGIMRDGIFRFSVGGIELR